VSDEKRMRRAFAFFTPIFRLFLRLRFGYRYDSLKGIPGPYLLLCNHNMELDPVLLGVTGGEPVHYVASEHIARKGFGSWFLMRYFQPILHVKGKSGQGTSLKIIRALRSGKCVAMFPEGNRSFNGQTGPMLGQLGRLARHCKASMVTYRIEGGYFTQPRWGTTLRRGRLVGHLVHVYTPEELAAMTDEQAEDAVAQDLFEDAYVTQQRAPVAYRGRHLALGMESALFWCPDCGALNTLTTDDDHIRCSCGMCRQYMPTGELVAADGKSLSITQWDAAQQRELQSYLDFGGETPLFSDEVRVRTIHEDHTAEDFRPVRLTAYIDHLVLGDEYLPMTALRGVAVFSRNVLNLHTEKLYEIRGELCFNALKYRYLVEMAKFQEN